MSAIKITILLVRICTLVWLSNANADTLRSAHIGADKKVHIVSATGKHSVLAPRGAPYDLRMSPDRRHATWLVGFSIPDFPNLIGADELFVYRNGRVRSLKCAPMIRAYAFRRQGQYIAIDCGGLHFAGTEYLYDIRTLRVVGAFDQANVSSEMRPEWSIDKD